MTSGLRRAAALAACLAGMSGAAAPAPAAARALSRAVLGELAYPDVLEDGEPVRLHGGRWVGARPEPGLASRPTVTLLPFLIARGDLDGDGREDAVVFLQSSYGGSGSFLHLSAVLDRPEGPRPLPAQAIGDRAEVEALEVVAGRVVLDAVVSGPADALCCPSQRIRRVFAVTGEALEEKQYETRGRLHARALAGTRWRLTRLDAGTPVPDDAGIELRFEGRQVTGSGGCNDFRADVVAGERDAFEVGTLETTARACPPPVMDRERRFFEALDRASRLGFWFGRLEIQYDTPQRRTGRLRLAPVAPG